MRLRFLLTGVVVFLFLGISSVGIHAQNPGKVPEPKVSRPADPPPFKIEWDPTINPDTKFYQLAANQRIENNSSTTWALNTLGFRDLRIVVFMTEAEKVGKVVSTSLRISLLVRDGEKEFEISKKDVGIETGPGKTSGEVYISSVYADSMILKVESRNMAGNLHLSTYLVK